jgi:hypothetical protein
MAGMHSFKEAVNWYVQHQNDIDFVKDIIFAIGVIATFYGYFKVLRFLTQRKMLNKRQEMENDSKLYAEVHDKLKEYVQDFGMTTKNLRDVGIRLLYMKNYPYNLENDGFRFMLYYYFITEHHQPSGYISGKGLYVMEPLWFWSEAVYCNPKNGKWFTGKKSQSFRGYHELKYKQLVKRIPFANILGYDFESDWADKGEPVFYTKYPYTDWKLYADDLEAVTIDKAEYPSDRVSLQKSKRAKRVRTLRLRFQNKIKAHFNTKKVAKLRKQQQKPKSK